MAVIVSPSTSTQHVTAPEEAWNHMVGNPAGVFGASIYDIMCLRCYVVSINQRRGLEDVMVLGNKASMLVWSGERFMTLHSKSWKWS